MDSEQNIAFHHFTLGNLGGLKQSFSSIPTEERRRIVNEKIDDRCVFFAACESNEFDFVNYMLDECSADVTLGGIFKDDKLDLNCSVPPLWIAAEKGNLAIVRSLVEHNASVNATSDNGSPALIASTRRGHREVVQFLLDSGADVNKTDEDNTVPLSYAARYDVGLCELLINNGASVNVINSCGYTPLIYAVFEGRLDLVKLFMCKGGDLRIKDKNGNDVVRVAALYSTKPVLDFIVQCTTFKKIEIIQAYELFGCALVDVHGNFGMALEVWQKAVSIRESVPSRPIKKIITNALENSVYNGFVEPTSIAAYLTAWSIEEIYMNALVVRERILGKSHRATLEGICFRAREYCNSKDYKRGLELLRFAYVIQRARFPFTEADSISTAKTIVSLLFVMESEIHANIIETRVQTSYYLDMLNMLVDHIEGGVEELTVRPLMQFSQRNFNVFMSIVLHFVNYQLNLELTEDESNIFRSNVQKLVTLCPKTDTCNTLLHEAMVKENSSVDNQFCSRFPSLTLVEILVENGACVNSINDSMETVLHILIDQLGNDSDDEGGLKIVEYLLKRNINLDICSNKGICPMNWLREKGIL